MNTAIQRSPMVFYGWYLVVVCLIIQGIATSVTIYSYSLFAGELESEFSANRATIMLGMTGQNVIIALASPILGALMDRVSIRWTVVAAAIVMGAGFVLISFSSSAWSYVAGYTFIVALGLATMGMLASSVLLSRWFQRQRGLAIGLAGLGTQLFGFIVPPLLAVLIDATDWRFTLRVVGWGVAIFVPLLVCATVVDHPEQRGLLPDGRSGAPLQDTDASVFHKAKGVSILDVFSDKSFWLSAFGIAVLVATFTTVLANLSLFAMDMGVSREDAALLISLFAVVGLVASPLIGRLCDVADIRWVFSAMMLLGAASMAVMLVAKNYVALAIATSLIAIAGGGLTAFWSALIGHLFDIRLYARAMGAMALVSGAAGSVAPFISGWLFDIHGSYRLLFLSLTVLMMIPLLYMPLIRKQRPRAECV